MKQFEDFSLYRNHKNSKNWNFRPNYGLDAIEQSYRLKMSFVYIQTAVRNYYQFLT